MRRLQIKSGPLTSDFLVQENPGASQASVPSQLLRASTSLSRRSGTHRLEVSLELQNPSDPVPAECVVITHTQVTQLHQTVLSPTWVHLRSPSGPVERSVQGFHGRFGSASSYRPSPAALLPACTLWIMGAHIHRHEPVHANAAATGQHFRCWCEVVGPTAAFWRSEARKEAAHSAITSNEGHVSPGRCVRCCLCAASPWVPATGWPCMP